MLNLIDMMKKHKTYINNFSNKPSDNELINMMKKHKTYLNNLSDKKNEIQ